MKLEGFKKLYNYTNLIVNFFIYFQIINIYIKVFPIPINLAVTIKYANIALQILQIFL